jgi:PAS domain S-box-containing protein
MRLRTPLLRFGSDSRLAASALHYGVAVLSTLLALLSTLLIPDVAESSLVLFAAAIMISAWYGGWKPGLVATAFALTVSSYISLRAHAPGEHSFLHLGLFCVVALLICWFNGELRALQDASRRSAANLRSLIANASYGICRCTLQGEIIDVNPAMAAMLGYASPAELSGRSLQDVYTDPQHWTVLADSLRARSGVQGLVVDWKRRDNVPVVVRISGHVVPGANGDGECADLFAEDVTERRALELQLRQSQKMEAVGRLAGGIAHDFNNLLMVISGHAQLMLEHRSVERSLRRSAQEISAASDRAANLVRQLLAFSRQQMLAPKLLDLNEVVTENLKMLTRIIGEDVELVMIPGIEPCLIKADPTQMEQVIMNLAVNARDAMPDGGTLTVEISNVRLDEGYARLHPPVPAGDYVLLAISDTGQGMDVETQAHIFEPFFTTKGTKGTGLGLSTVYGIVKQSGGYIWVYSEPDQGATFKVYLPRVTGAIAADALARAPELIPQAPRGNETVLVVEDEPRLRQLTRTYLEMQGYTVLDAEDGVRALETALGYNGSIDLLLTDLVMPKINGRQLAEQIASVRPGIRVLYMSGYSENVIAHNGTLEYGVTFLQKPFTLYSLSQKLRQALLSPAPKEATMPEARSGPQNNPLAVPRAQRFTLQMPVRYRRAGEQAWHVGTTENISRSGVLFRADDILEPSTLLEMNLVLPVEIAGLAAAEVVCRGEVVRAVEPQQPEVSPALAARILQYHFQHGPHPGNA